MVDELTVSVSLRFAKGGIDVSLSRSGVQLDVDGSDYTKNVQVVGITEELLQLGDVTPGYILIVNLDRTNFVEVRAESGAADLVKILPGEPALFRLSSATPYVIADTAPVRIEYLLIEN